MTQNINENRNENRNETLLLALLPFWDPQIPPAGISCLKGYLAPRGWQVRTVDANVEDDLKEYYHRYFNALKEHIPADKQGNFFKVGHEVFRNHLLARVNLGEYSPKYIELIRNLIYNTFYTTIDDHLALELDTITGEFFDHLGRYFINLLEKEKPTVLGLSVFEGTLAASLHAFRLTRQHFPHIKTLMGGGIFASSLAEDSPDLALFLEKTSPYIDKMFIGESEVLLLKYLQGELPETQRVYRLSDINGQLVELSGVALPDVSDFQLEAYPYLPAYGSRSCPFQCSFCTETIQWGRYRKKTVQQTVQELVRLYKQYGSQIFLLSDSLLNPLITDLAAEMIRVGEPVYWDAFLRVEDKVGEPDRVFEWRRGGFYRARLGVESGSAHVLEMMDKRITPAQTRKSLSTLAMAGIKTTTYWVIGHPGETEADFQETLDLISEMRDDIYEADCTPFLYYPKGQVGKEGWEKNSRDLYGENAHNYLWIRTWLLEGEPTREETYRRMWRFIDHCRKVGVPNPYSFSDIHKADQRWQKLHKQAVPALTEFQGQANCIDEVRNLKPLLLAQETPQDEDDFGF